MASNLLRCVRCSYSTALWVDWKAVGYEVMSKHVAAAHIEEYRLVRKGLAELDEDIRLAEAQAGHQIDEDDDDPPA